MTDKELYQSCDHDKALRPCAECLRGAVDQLRERAETAERERTDVMVALGLSLDERSELRERAERAERELTKQIEHAAKIAMERDNLRRERDEAMALVYCCPPPTGEGARHPGMTDDQDYLIFDANSGLYWGPNSAGYVSLLQAGIFSEEYAKKVAANRDPHRNDHAIPLDEKREELEAIQRSVDRLLKGTDTP